MQTLKKTRRKHKTNNIYKSFDKTKQASRQIFNTQIKQKSFEKNIKQKTTEIQDIQPTNLREQIYGIHSRSGPGLNILYSVYFMLFSKLFCLIYVCSVVLFCFRLVLFKLLHLQSNKYI